MSTSAGELAKYLHQYYGRAMETVLISRNSDGAYVMRDFRGYHVCQTQEDLFWALGNTLRVQNRFLTDEGVKLPLNEPTD